MVDSEMAELVERTDLARIEEAYATVTTDLPLGRPALPEDTTTAVVFLRLDDAAMITGTSLTFDGGATAVDVPTLAFSRIRKKIWASIPVPMRPAIVSHKQRWTSLFHPSRDRIPGTQSRQNGW